MTQCQRSRRKRSSSPTRCIFTALSIPPQYAAIEKEKEAKDVEIQEESYEKTQDIDMIYFQALILNFMFDILTN